MTVIAAGPIALADMANLAQDLFIGRVTASTGVPETATITAAARTVLDDTTVVAMCATLLVGNPHAPTTYASNGVLYGNAGGSLAVTAQGAANTVLTANAGAPSFSATPTLTTLTTTSAVLTPYLITGGPYDTSLTFGNLSAGGGTVYGGYAALGGRDNASGTQYGGISFVGDTRNASAIAGLITFSQYDGATWSTRLSCAKSGVIAIGPQTATAAFHLPAGTATASTAPGKVDSGTLLTSAEAGVWLEYDGVQFYQTIDTTSGRGAVDVAQYFHLTSDGSTISTIANYFGSTSNIALVASAYYLIDIYCYFLNTTANTVTWTLTNSSAPTAQNIYVETSPIGGVVAPPGTATALIGQFSKDATAAKAWTSGTLANAADHYMRIRIELKNGSGTSLKIQATKNVGGTITPRIGSYWTCRRISPNNIGTFVA